MSSPSSAPRIAWWRKPITKVVAGISVAALVVTGAVVAQGYDAQELPRVESSVWVVRDSGQYARVNTDLGEIDTVRSVDDPSTVAQSGPNAVIFGQSNRQLWTIDPAVPADLVADAAPVSGESDNADEGPDVNSGLSDAATDDTPAETTTATQAATPTPAGTRSIATAGDFSVVITDIGAVFVGSLSNPDQGFIAIDPYADIEEVEGEDPLSYVANAASVSPTGDVVVYSAAEAGIRQYNADTREFTSDLVTINSPPDVGEPVTMTMVGATWVLHAPGEQLVWIDGRGEPSATSLGADALLQQPSAAGSTVWLADSAGMVSLDLATGQVSSAVGGGATAAAPVVIDDVAYGAWLDEDGGSLYASDTGEIVDLITEEEPFDGVSAVIPVIRSNGDRAVLNEMATGMLWTIPDGRLIPTEQWNLDNNDDVEDDTVVIDDADEQEPPTAVADTFGVRSGSLAVLPLLFNDHDPNRTDVLTIDRSSLGGLSDSGFGAVSLVANSQTATVRVGAAAGSSSFAYAVSDGAAVSAPVPVTLNVIPNDVNTAPVWCGVEACTQIWPTPLLASGGTITVPVLNGWVDPEGDAFVLADVRKADPSDPIAVVATADGSVAIRHTDPNAPSGSMVVTVSVMDSFGAVAEKDMTVAVSSAPQLDLRPSAITAAVGELTSIEVDDLVGSGSGSYRLVDAIDSSATAGILTVAPNSSSNSIDVSATTPGEYIVSYAVQDTLTLSEKTAIVRVTVVPVSSTIAIAPLTAFVRPGEDVTVGVLESVQNETGRVLSVYQVTPRQPQLTASIVGQSSVRVRGTTIGGLPGPIGTVGVTVVDGAGTLVEGEITVFLVQPARDIAPIAVPDTVTVRAGAQVDIPVLDNDVSPRGEKLAVAPDLATSGTAGELAFVADGVVRYLAPTVPGTHTVTYNAYLEGAPDRLAAAPITITVLAPGSNRPPQPRTLVGRALAGGTTEIAVPSVGADPDGDAVSLVSVTQPAPGEGSASISAEGTSLIYRAPAAGVADGQTSFTYTLRDSAGESARGTVRVGVLADEDADLTPLTFSTQVRTQAGSTTPLTILPLLTDSDPAGGTLSIIDLVPNAPANADNPEYARLTALIDPATDLEAGVVSLRAGDVIGSHSYIYTVQSSKSSSTAQGLIVVGVSELVAADRPVVIDTTVTLVSRDKLSSGIDVISDKVQWVSGDTSALTLSVWGDAADSYTAKGGRISGPLPKVGTLVPFQLAGADAAGAEIVAYGFLRIPAVDDMRVQSRSSAPLVTLNEEATKTISVTDFVQVGSGDRLEVRDDEPFAVQRTNATCALDEGTQITYSAGREAPWSDTCTLGVRIEGQSTWTTISIAISIIPNDPQAILSSISRTVSPGATETVNLYDNMTTWEGGREGDRSDLDFSFSYGGSAFTIVQSDDTVTFEAHADAVPGTRETVNIGVTSFGGLSSTISLVVGIAPPDAPKGASFSHQCTVSAGPSCVITATGISGQYDPFDGKTGGGLTLVNVASQSCSVATIAVSGTQDLVATWPVGPRPAGGDCTATFTVKDAQGRTGLGELRLDVLGYPATPSSIVTTNFGPSWVELTVTLGEASLAHPALTGVALYEGSTRVTASCTPNAGAYVCRVPGLVHGAHHFYTARTVNSVGESLDTSAAETWAYDFPVVNSATAVPVFDAARTTATAGAVDLTISAGSTASEFRVLVDGGQVAVFATAGPTTNQRITITGTGTRTVVIEPNSGTIAPPIPRAHDGSKTTTVTVAGAPSMGSGGGVSASSTTLTASFGTPNANGAASPFPLVYGIADNSGLTCSGSPTGAPAVNGASLTQNSGAFTGLASNKRYWVIACYGNGYGIASSPDLKSAFTFNSPGGPGGDLEYRVASAASSGSYSEFNWGLESGPNPTSSPGFTLVWSPSAFPNSLSPDSIPNYSVKNCFFGEAFCSQDSFITPELGSAPTSVVVRFIPSGGGCAAPVNTDDANQPPTPEHIAAAVAQATSAIYVSSVASPHTSVAAVWDDVGAVWNYSASFGGTFSNTTAVSFSCTP